jgi:hypothetical protein
VGEAPQSIPKSPKNPTFLDERWFKPQVRRFSFGIDLALESGNSSTGGNMNFNCPSSKQAARHLELEKYRYSLMSRQNYPILSWYLFSLVIVTGLIYF